MKSSIITAALVLASSSAFAAAANYKIDASHTYPSFEADHMGGLSVWRGKIRSNSGMISYDKAGKAGTVDITMDMSTIDFGHDKMSEHAKGADMFDVAKFPNATFKGKLGKFNGESPTEVVGELTLHGVTKPVTLKINSFLCKVNPMSKKEKCGADASGTINREDYGVSFGKDFGFKMDVKLQIQVEAEIAQ